jgi:HD-GYP domain-containing protein (c-di-GMP phosphodiesterase class II)
MAPERQAGLSDLEKLRLLLEVSRLVAGKLELKPLIREVLKQASRLVHADRTTLWLYDEDTHELYSFVGEGWDDEKRIPLGTGVAGHAAAERRVIAIADAYESELFDPTLDRATGYRTRSLLAVPIESHQGRLLGCLQGINRLDDADSQTLVAFTPQDIELMESLAAITAVAVENARLYGEQQQQFDSFITALAQTVDAKDSTTSNHTKLVTGIAVALARQLELPEEVVQRILLAATLHDFGKIGVPDSVLLKPGKHDDDERQVMKSHVLKTILILSRISFRRELRDIPFIAGMHHEKLDGTGYPFGLQGEEIPLEGRILAVADVFQALTQTRPYKSGMPLDRALAFLREEFCKIDRENGVSRGPHLDSNVVDALEMILATHPDPLAHFEDSSSWDKLEA